MGEFNPPVKIYESSGKNQPIIIVAPALAAFVVALLFAFYLYCKLRKAKTGTDIGKPKIDALAKRIKEGAKAFLREEYKILAIFIIFAAIVLVIVFSVQSIVKAMDTNIDGLKIGGAFLVGAILSASTGYLGMMVATDGNSRTCAACADGTLNDGLTVAFTSGAVMGFMVVGVGAFGLSVMFLLLTIGIFDENDVNGAYVATGGEPYSYSAQLLAGFGFGASSIALFARVAGGIYTKAADVGADLVGKVEAGIDEDDPHNPAVIADNVGDNVGDVAGMGADLFESFVGSVIAAVTLASTAASNYDLLQKLVNDGDFTSTPCENLPANIGVTFTDANPCVYDISNDILVTQQGLQLVPQLVALPFWLIGNGIVCSLVGCFFVSTKEKGDGWNVQLSSLMWALEKGMYIAAALFVGCSVYVVILLFGAGCVFGWKLFGCIIIGLFAGVCIGKITEYFTSFDFGPVISIKDRGLTGPATVIIQGLGVGMISCLPPTVVLVATILACDALASSYGISIAAVGMLATLGITLATDAYGPVADNAGGLAELTGLDSSVRDKTDSLDALGNTTAATGKGFAIGSAVLTSLSLLAAFKRSVSGESILNTVPYDADFSVSSPTVLAGVIFGAVLPFLFAALTMISVGKAAAEIIIEVRRQFREQKNEHGKTLLESIKWCTDHPGEECPAEFEVEPDSNRCVEISTRSSIREMIAPGAYAILAPLFVGLLIGPEMLMGTLAGSIAAGAMMAIMMSNAGGAWDNGKKLCEKLQIKKTEQGKACVVGDTVGDPFKDTSGPSLNILIKLMSMVSLVIAPLIERWTVWPSEFYYGFIPLGLFFIVTSFLMYKKILTWEDPLNEVVEKKDSGYVKAEEVTEETPALANQA